MKKTIPILIMLLLVFTTSCSNDNEGSGITVLTKETEVTSEYTGYYNYFYDSNNKPIKIELVINNELESVTTITYNTDGKIDEIITPDTKKKLYYNTNKTIQKRELFYKTNNGWVKDVIEEYEYQNNKIIITRNKVSDNAVEKMIAEYDAAGNILKIGTYENVSNANPNGKLSPLSERSFSAYDNKKHIYSMFPPEYLSPKSAVNNATVEQTPFGTVTSVFEYNSKGYVTKRVRDGVVSTYEYEVR